MGEKIIVTVEGQVRGTNAQTSFGFVADEGTCTWTWGLQPAEALVSWVKESGPQETILPLAAMTIEIGGHSFYGICEEAVVVDSHESRSVTQRFRDSRTLLQYDMLYGQFNFRDTRLINGEYRVRYRHLLPINSNANFYTFTNTPYTAAQILNFCFGAQTVESPWTRMYHPALNQPVFDVDAWGRKLGTVVAEVSARAGTTFTLSGGRYNLIWTMKGVGLLPAFPANATARRVGLSVSDSPTRLRVLGDRNLYQVLNIEMQRDWLPAWEQFVSLEYLADDLFKHESLESAIAGIPAGTRYNAIAGDTDQLIGRQLAAARSHVILVEEYAALRDVRSGDGNQFRDTRRALGQSRLQMPAATYIRMMVWRAFRPPLNFGFYNYQNQFNSLVGLELTDRAILDVTHDPATGVMGSLGASAMAGNGYAIVRGYAVGSDALKTLRPELFNLSHWQSTQFVWQAVPFQIDDSGEDGKFILFDEPVIHSQDLIEEVMIAGVTQAYPALKRLPTISVPAVKASLAFYGERFALVVGVGTRDDVEHAASLNGQFLVTGAGLSEVAFADGETATQKAAAIGNSLLSRQFIIAAGGYEVQGSNATQLTAMIDRVTVTLNGAAGLSESVDFANARDRNVDAWGRVQIEPVRDFERKAQMQPLFPGQREDREAANHLRLQASALRQNPRLARLLYETFHLLMGLDAPPDVLHPQSANPGDTLPAGAPLFRDVADKRPWMPGTLATAARLPQPIFMGVTIFNQEKADGPVRATRNGAGNIILARVKGPVTFNAAVGIPAGEADDNEDDKGLAVDYLVADPLAPLGNCLTAWEGEEIRLVQVQVSGAGGQGTSGVNYKGDYVATEAYQKNDIVRVKAGGTPGLFIAWRDKPASAAAEYQPVYPEPDEDEDTYWHLWTLGPKHRSDCVGTDTKGIYINASDPF